MFIFSQEFFQAFPKKIKKMLPAIKSYNILKSKDFLNIASGGSPVTRTINCQQSTEKQ